MSCDTNLTHFLAILQANEHYVLLARAQQQLDANEDVQGLLHDFASAKENFSEAQRFGKYHPDYTTYQRALAIAKQQLDQHPDVKDYKQAQKGVQALLNQMSIRLGSAISEHLVVPTDYFGAVVPSKNCGSSCGCGK